MIEIEDNYSFRIIIIMIIMITIIRTHSPNPGKQSMILDKAALLGTDFWAKCLAKNEEDWQAASLNFKVWSKEKKEKKEKRKTSTVRPAIRDDPATPLDRASPPDPPRSTSNLRIRIIFSNHRVDCLKPLLFFDKTKDCEEFKWDFSRKTKPLLDSHSYQNCVSKPAAMFQQLFEQ